MQNRKHVGYQRKKGLELTQESKRLKNENLSNLATIGFGFGSACGVSLSSVISGGADGELTTGGGLGLAGGGETTDCTVSGLGETGDGVRTAASISGGEDCGGEVVVVLRRNCGGAMEVDW